jgi:hypothetical protein
MSDRVSDYHLLKQELLSRKHTFLSLPTSPARLHLLQQQSHTSGSSDPLLPTISSLSLHPAIETALHLLNNDLPSAHFLVRHAQSAPAYDCMYLHGILHRIEGDVNNARCWYRDVSDSDVLKAVWSSIKPKGEWTTFLDRVEKRRDVHAGRTKANQGEGVDAGEDVELSKISLWELKRLLEVLEARLGLDEMADSSKIWVQPDKEIGDKGNAMIVGGEGWREF